MARSARCTWVRKVLLPNFIALAMNIVFVVFGALYKGETCQQQTIIQVDDWLFLVIAGSFHLSLYVAIVLGYSCMRTSMWSEDVFAGNRYQRLPGWLYWLDVLQVGWYIAWSLVGAFLLGVSREACNSKNQPLGILVILYISVAASFVFNRVAVTDIIVWMVDEVAAEQQPKSGRSTTYDELQDQEHAE